MKLYFLRYITSYKLYTVKSKKKENVFYDTEVTRRFIFNSMKFLNFLKIKIRFSDFEWLYYQLIDKFGGYLIPILPEKNILTKINVEGLSFSLKRRSELETFM